MHAVRYDSRGGGAAGLKHVEIPVPSPKKGELLIKVEAVGLNPAEWRIQQGLIPFAPPTFPFVPASDIAGLVVAVGKGVTSFKPGDAVVAYLGLLTGGGLAEYAVAQEVATALRPPEVPAAVAAGLPMAGLTAVQAVRMAGINLDAPATPAPLALLITGASGGVGTYAVQLAKLVGNVHVTATCSTRNIELVRSLGADEVLDYKTPEGASLRSPSGKKYDAVVHCAKGIPWSTFEPNLSERGRVIDLTPELSSLGTAALQMVTFSKKKLAPFMIRRSKQDMELLVGLIKQGKLKTVEDSRYPFSKIEEAWAKGMAGHTTGKIIIHLHD